MRRAVIAFLLLAGCAHQSPPAPVETRSVTVEDSARHRPIPVLLYSTKGPGARPLAVLSHGYGGSNADYDFIAEALARRGYLVASIQHLERATDPPMVNGDNLVVRRRPVWQVGADSIGAVIARLKAKGIAGGKSVVLIGHSNGGDMTMLFATEHPALVRAALSLDNRRMPLPRTASPRICSMRSSDLPADPGVLPSPNEQRKLRMLITPVPVAHDDMGDGATKAQKRAMLAVLAACLAWR